MAATRDEPPSPGRAQRVAVLERRRDAVRALVARREDDAAQLATSLGALSRLRGEVERAETAGVAAAGEALRRAMDGVERCVQATWRRREK